MRTARKQAFVRQAGLGPWTQLLAELQRLRLLDLVGQSAKVVERVEQLQSEMAALPETLEGSQADERVEHWQVRESLFSIGASAARNLKDWSKALAFNAQVAESKRRRDAPLLEQARTRFNDYPALLRSGRVLEARELLRTVREVYARERDLESLGKVTNALADVEDELGHRDTAITLAQDALRLGYAVGDVRGVATRHFNLATYLDQDPSAALAHRLAEAVLRLHTGEEGELAVTLRTLASDLQQDNLVVPESFAQLCAQVERADGVRLGQLVAQLPPYSGGPGAALAEVLHRARTLPTDQAIDSSQCLRQWGPVIGAIAAAAGGDETAATWIQQYLADTSERPDWAALTERLDRVLAGERDPEQLLAELDPVDTAIVRRTLDVLAGHAQLTSDEADTWRALALLDTWRPIIDLVVAAAGGEQQADTQLAPLLTDLEQDPDWAALVRVLRQMAAGAQDPGLLEGLDPTDTLIASTVLDELSGA